LKAFCIQIFLIFRGAGQGERRRNWHALVTLLITLRHDVFSRGTKGHKCVENVSEEMRLIAVERYSACVEKVGK
jgi:hypothetical protein